VTRFETAPAPHWAPRGSVRRVMCLVMVALVPATLAHLWFFGVGIVLQIGLAMTFAMAIEAAMLRLRRQPIAPFLGDGSALVTAWLFALCIPPLAPWWIAAIGMLAAIGCAKHLYGGLGYNLFNPAMVGYAVVLICFPQELSQWLASSLSVEAAVDLRDAVVAVFTGLAPGGDWDAVTRATPLDVVRELGREGRTLTEIVTHPSVGVPGGTSWTWIATAVAGGGIALCMLRVADWRTPAAVIGATIVVSLPFWLGDADVHPAPLQHLLGGGLMLAAFFIATDPVSGCTTPRGRWIFGAGVAILTLAIRRWGAYPDGVAFAILLMNAAAPLIDRLTPTRIFGRPR
jgi:electron transport complex protein RnfD